MKTELPLVDKWADTVFVGNQRTYTYSDLMAQRDADQEVVDAKDAEIERLQITLKAHDRASEDFIKALSKTSKAEIARLSEMLLTPETLAYWIRLIDSFVLFLEDCWIIPKTCSISQFWMNLEPNLSSRQSIKRRDEA